jgi:aspartokinase-like uncharacterized kinase
MLNPIIVVKVGGSLMNWPELGPQLKLWLPTLATGQILIVPGGGATADVVRDLDRCHRLGEEAAHWLALQALTLNAHFLATILTSWRARVVDNLPEAKLVWSTIGLPVLDLLQFAEHDEWHPGRLPHLWSTTSDSLAARVAVQFEARRLILLKSAHIPPDRTWFDPTHGLVDPFFNKVLDELPTGRQFLEVSAINFREWRD